MDEQYASFLELVAKMRDAQKDYFATRTRRNLHRALELEKQVDVYLLAARVSPAQACVQSTLWEE